MDEQDPTPRVVVGVSDTGAARAALATAVEEARRRGAELVAVRAWGPIAAPSATEPPVPSLEEELTRRSDEDIDRAFIEVCGGIPGDITVTRHTVEGVPERALVTVADRLDDLLVVGRERHIALHRMLRGSAAGYCVDHAVCRVLVVPAPPSSREPDETAAGIFY